MFCLKGKGVDVMGISLLFLVVISIIFISTITIPIIIAARKNENRIPPRKISYVIVALLLLHWVFFLTSGYALLPTNIADAIFMPVWLVLCGAGAITAIYEFKGNKVFAIPVAGLTTISLLFSFFSYGLSKM
ncbi:hypothetical protein [Ornithinibacillus sp. FSL M8-0202]|uniref:hypothetical protein n=1 Tax=unclassified Ornithinibacillus TaxID=2620869 RepID=UPI0030CD571C